MRIGIGALTVFLVCGWCQTRAEPVFTETDGYVCIEAEAVTPQGNWEVHTSTATYDFIGGFTGDGCIQFTGNTEAGGSANSPIEYTIKITNPGTYLFKMRLFEGHIDNTLEDQSNDVYVRMNGQADWLGQDTKCVTMAEGRQWSWTGALEPSHHDFHPANYSLDAGEHTFVLSGRSKNCFVDRFVIHKDLSRGEDTSLTLPATVPGPANPITVSFSSPAVNAICAVTKPIASSITAISTGTTVTGLTLFADDQEITSVSGGSLTRQLTGLPVGQHTLTATAVDNQSNSLSSRINVNVVHPDSMRIEAEHFTAMEGVHIQPCGDEGGGHNVGWINPGDWMEYPAPIGGTGTYTVRFRAACPHTGCSLKLMQNGQEVAVVPLPRTGDWQNWQTAEGTATLSNAYDNIRVAAPCPFNLNWLEIVSHNPTTATLPRHGSAVENGMAGTMHRGAACFDLRGKRIAAHRLSARLSGLSQGVYVVRGQGSCHRKVVER